MKKKYCTQNDNDCETCSLVNYGRDCRNNPIEPNREPVEIVELDKSHFELEMNRARCMTIAGGDASYWSGYTRGLRCAYHGAAFGTPGEHALWIAAADSDDMQRRARGRGYRGGLRGVCDPLIGTGNSEIVG